MTKGENTEKNFIIKKILVVDDNQFVRDYIRELFYINGYDIKTTSTASEALHILSSEYFHVVITEFILPDLKGIAILDYIQQQGLGTAVLFVTTLRSADSVLETLRLGAYDYITKPFTSHILLHRVAQAVEYIRMKGIIRDFLT